MFENSILSLLVWLPIIGGILLLAIGNSKVALVRIVALLISVITFLICIPLWAGFDVNSTGLQYEELSPWITAFNVNYHLGIDGIALPLVALTTFITVLTILSS